MSPGLVERQHGPEGIAARWRTTGAEGSEVLSLRWENGGWVAEGVLSNVDATYVVRFAPDFTVSQFLLFRDLDEPDLWLGHDGRGNWGEINGARRAELSGCRDLDVTCAVFPLTAGVRRLGLTVGESRVVPVVAVDVETLAVERTELTVTATATERWHLNNPGTGVDDELTFGADGVALDVASRGVRY
jgi:hypothetical protein